jgi:hypothetical protein
VTKRKEKKNIKKKKKKNPGRSMKRKEEKEDLLPKKTAQGGRSKTLTGTRNSNPRLRASLSKRWIEKLAVPPIYLI